MWRVLFVIALASACATRGKPCEPGETPAEIVVVVSAAERLNRDASERSLPTWVRLYQLSGTATLEQAELEATWADGEATLGDAVLAVEEHVVHPGQEQAWTLERKPEARYLAAVALYREPAGTAWRGAMRLPGPARCKSTKPVATPRLYVRLEGSAVRVGALDPRPRRKQGGAS